jgi:hypothetical protein
VWAERQTKSSVGPSSRTYVKYGFEFTISRVFSHITNLHDNNDSPTLMEGIRHLFSSNLKELWSEVARLISWIPIIFLAVNPACDTPGSQAINTVIGHLQDTGTREYGP